jgi:hypothetical protein
VPRVASCLLLLPASLVVAADSALAQDHCLAARAWRCHLGAAVGHAAGAGQLWCHAILQGQAPRSAPSSELSWRRRLAPVLHAASWLVS